MRRLSLLLTCCGLASASPAELVRKRAAASPQREVIVRRGEDLQLWNPWRPTEPVKGQSDGLLNVTLVAAPALAAVRAAPTWAFRAAALFGLNWFLPPPALRTVQLAYVASAVLSARSPKQFAVHELSLVASSPSTQLNVCGALLRRVRFRLWRRIAVRVQLVRLAGRMWLRSLSPLARSRDPASLRKLLEEAAKDAARLQGLFAVVFDHASLVAEGCRLPYRPVTPEATAAAMAPALGGKTPRPYRPLEGRALQKMAREIEAAFGGLVAVVDADGRVVATRRWRGSIISVLRLPRLGRRLHRLWHCRKRRLTGEEAGGGDVDTNGTLRQGRGWRLGGLGFRANSSSGSGGSDDFRGGSGGSGSGEVALWGPPQPQPQPLLLADVAAAEPSPAGPFFVTHAATLISPGGARRGVAIVLSDRRQQCLAADDARCLRRMLEGWRRRGWLEMDWDGVGRELQRVAVEAKNMAMIAEGMEAVRTGLKHGGLLGTSVVMAAPLAKQEGGDGSGGVFAAKDVMITPVLRGVPLAHKYAMEHAVAHTDGERRAFLGRVLRAYAHMILVEGVWPSSPRLASLLYTNEGLLGLPAPLVPVSRLSSRSRGGICRLYLALERAAKRADAGGGADERDEDAVREAMDAVGLAVDLPTTARRAPLAAAAAAAAAGDVTRVALARAVLDTRVAGLPQQLLDPLAARGGGEKSCVSVKRLPAELAPLLRTVASLRGICAHLDVDASLLEEFAAAARRGLLEGGGDSDSDGGGRSGSNAWNWLRWKTAATVQQHQQETFKPAIIRS